MKRKASIGFTPSARGAVGGGQCYFTAVYPDYAVAESCVACHDAHKDPPRPGAAAGDVMGGAVIRIPTG